MNNTISKGKKLLIVFLDFDDLKNPLLSGGQARATFEVARRLVNLGHKVTIICSRYPHSKDETHKGIFYKHIGLGTQDIRKNNLAYFFALPRAVIGIHADVIIECFTAPISTYFSPLFTRTPVIGMPTMFEAQEFAKKYHLPFHWIERFGCRFYNYFIAYSHVNKKKMELYNPTVVTKIIPNGVSEEFFSIKEKEGDYALFIGRIDSFQKGLDLLLKACKKLNGVFPIKIVIAGNGTKNEEQNLQFLIKKYNLSHLVSFVGRVDGEEKERIIANSLFGIVPSRFEDFPLVPLEFASLGKPIICFDIPGLFWVSPKVAIKIKPFNTTGFSAAIETLAENKITRSQLKKNCRKFARKYGWNSIAKQYEEFFYEVITMEKEKKGRSYL